MIEFILWGSRPIVVTVRGWLSVCLMSVINIDRSVESQRAAFIHKFKLTEVNSFTEQNEHSYQNRGVISINKVKEEKTIAWQT